MASLSVGSFVARGFEIENGAEKRGNIVDINSGLREVSKRFYALSLGIPESPKSLDDKVITRLAVKTRKNTPTLSDVCISTKKKINLTPLKIPGPEFSFDNVIIKLSVKTGEETPSISDVNQHIYKFSKEILNLTPLEGQKSPLEGQKSPWTNVPTSKESISTPLSEECEQKQLISGLSNNSFFVKHMKNKYWKEVPNMTAAVFYSGKSLRFRIKISDKKNVSVEIFNLNDLYKERELLSTLRIRNLKSPHIVIPTLPSSEVEKLLEQSSVKVGTYAFYRISSHYEMLAIKTNNGIKTHKVISDDQDELSWFSSVTVMTGNATSEFDSVTCMLRNLEGSKLFQFSEKVCSKDYGWAEDFF